MARLSSCEVSRCEVYRSEAHEILMRIDMKHSYSLIICLPSIFSVRFFLLLLFSILVALETLEEQ